MDLMTGKIDKNKEYKMKHILFFILVLLISINLLGGIKAEIVKKEDSILTIDKGEKHGIKVGMKGVVQKRVQGSPINLGIFVVIRAVENTSELYITELPGKIKMKTAVKLAVQVEFFKASAQRKKQSGGSKRLKRDIKTCLKRKHYNQAAELIKKVIQIADDEEMKKLAKGVDLLNSVFSADDYLNYRATHPGSPILGDLKEKLYKNYPILPPEFYLDMASRIKKNSQDYFEIEFKNSHTMIYVPELKLFVDKYEVSNYQYLKFADENNKEITSIHFSTLEGYPRCCEDYPAIVSFDEAEAYCRANNLRLPTEGEWEIIAGKGKEIKYSWGDMEIDSLNEFRGNFESIKDGYIEVAPVKSFEDYPSPFGAVNIMGNVSEWVKGNVCKGGGYFSEKEKLTFEYRSKNCIRVGFRCVMDVK